MSRNLNVHYCNMICYEDVIVLCFVCCHLLSTRSSKKKCMDSIETETPEVVNGLRKGMVLFISLVGCLKPQLIVRC